LRVQELMAVRLGRYAEAERLLGEELEASREARDVSEESAVYNSLGIFHAGLGQLRKAKEAYLRAAALAREIGLKRREGVAIHNLGLVEGELGNVAEARRCQEEYLALSRSVGNQYAEAYGPAAIASALLGTADLEEAERYAEQARRIAEEHSWYFLKAWTVGLQGQVGLLRASAKTPRAAVQSAVDSVGTALKMLHDKQVHWIEELDPGELYVFLAVGTAVGLGPGAARAVLDRGQELVPPSCVVSHAWLEAGRALLAGLLATEWFSERGYIRSTSLLERLNALLHRSV
jgi:tetratricopeptide (TPR) repeat protein